MSAKAKKDRDELELKLLGAHQAILELCGNSPLQRAGKRAADRKLGDLENIWEKLVSSHREYCKHAGLGLDSEESKEFIFSKQKLKDEAYFTVEKAQGEDDSTSDEGKIRRMKKTVAVLQREVGFNLPALADYGNEALNSEAFKQALEMLEDTENKVRRYVDLSATIEDLLDDAEAEEYGKTVDTVHIQHGTQLSKLRGLIGRKAPEKKEIKPEVNAMQAPSGRVGGSLGGKLPVKIKPLDCPTWDGKFKTFGRFKKMWSENITPRHEESALHFMLCQALPKHILDNISTLTNSAEEIWNYLDEKYGRSEVVAREIMAELMSLDPKRLGSRFIGKFCTTLMDTHSLLKSINEEDWLVGNRTVSELEVKLPREEKLEWARQYSTLPGVTKFERFKEFLQQRKTVMEVLESMGEMSGGGSGSSKCGYCSKPGHAEDQCFTKQRDQAGNQSGRKKFDGCAICGSDGHWKNECPEKGTSMDKRSGGGRGGSTNSTRIRSKGVKGGGKGGGGGDGSGGAADGDGGHSTGADIGSNTLRPLECQRCKFSSKFSSCAGCKKTSNIGHCLLHCPNFNLLSVNDKVAIVKSSKSCAICLHPSHTSDKCDYRDRDKNICGFDGCKSHHHPCLHGSKDTYVTGVNVLLMQQVKECVEIESWFDRQQYVHDSFALDTTSGKTKTRREEALEAVENIIKDDELVVEAQLEAETFGDVQEAFKEAEDKLEKVGLLARKALMEIDPSHKAKNQGKVEEALKWEKEIKGEGLDDYQLNRKSVVEEIVDDKEIGGELFEEINLGINIYKVSFADMVMIERQGINYKENPYDKREDVLIVYKEAEQGSMVDEDTFHNMMKLTIRWDEVEPGNWFRVVVNKLVMVNKLTISWEDVEHSNWARVVMLVSIYLKDVLQLTKLFSRALISWEEVELGNWGVRKCITSLKRKEGINLTIQW